MFDHCPMMIGDQCSSLDDLDVLVVGDDGVGGGGDDDDGGGDDGEPKMSLLRKIRARDWNDSKK